MSDYRPQPSPGPLFENATRESAPFDAAASAAPPLPGLKRENRKPVALRTHRALKKGSIAHTLLALYTEAAKTRPGTPPQPDLTDREAAAWLTRRMKRPENRPIEVQHVTSARGGLMDDGHVTLHCERVCRIRTHKPVGAYGLATLPKA